MATQGPLDPNTAANDATVGTTDWTNPDNAKVSDGVYTTATVVAGGSAKDFSVKIVKSDGSLGSQNKASATAYPSTEAYASYGGSADLWGETWAASDINNANFGLAFSSFGADSTTKYLKVTNYSFSIPTGAKINGILAEVQRRSTGPSGGGNVGVDDIRITVTYTMPSGPFPTYFH